MVAAERTSPITLDGRLDEPAWGASTPATAFRQSEPNEGQPATQPTEMRILYDDVALYIGARMHDSLGARGVRAYLTRRDQQNDGDYLEIIFDTFHDHTGRTIFQINPAGVKTDAGQAASNADPSWDPIWEAATAIDSLGWTAELRIPFAQLRCSATPVDVGMHCGAMSYRLNATSCVVLGSKRVPWPPLFGHIEGLACRERPRLPRDTPVRRVALLYIPIREA